jgi:predicted GH43/DUF377 family glycosyl hydrolase
VKWRKLGLLYAPDGRQAWARAHAMLPTPLMLSEGIVRLYVAHTDEEVRGRVGYVDVALADPTRALRVAKAPVLDIGEPGDFDDNGVNPCCAVPVDGEVRLYYVGYQLQRQVPYTLFSGLAIGSGADGPFDRFSRVPILDRTGGERYFRTAPFVMRDGARWRMWYIGGDGWTEDQSGKKLPCYSMRHVESSDGLSWNGPSVECLTPEGPEEIGFGRPFVVREAMGYCMWYSIRSRAGYKIGYAESADGLHWERRDEAAGIEPSAAGWDSEMICFAAIVPARDGWVMFYNGNGYGRTGVGVAISDGR